MRARQITFVLLLCALVTSCSSPVEQVAASGSPQIWIDLPIDGSVLPLAPVDILVHASSGPDIASLEYYVDDTLIATVDVETDEDGLVADAAQWEQVTAGEHVIQVRAQDSSGAWSDPAQARVHLGEPTSIPDEPTRSPEPTATETPASTTIFTPLFEPAVFHFVGRDCPVQSATIRVMVEPWDTVTNTVLFLRFSDDAIGYDSGWDAGHSMRSEGSGWYRYIVTSEGLPDFSSEVNLVVRTQFVATNAEGEQVARSPVYTELRLTSRCTE